MMNEKGSVLTITLSLVLVFLFLGLASIQYTSVQNEIAEDRLSSMEALWAADAGVELARAKLNRSSPVLIPQGNPAVDLDPDGKRRYYVYSEPDPGCPTCLHRWHINGQGYADLNDADGSLMTQFRGIDAIAAYYDIDAAITTHGTVNGSCVQDGNATIIGNCQAHANFDFVSVFGMTYAELIALAVANLIDPAHPAYDATAVPPVVDHAFHLDSASDIYEYIGVTVTFLEGNLGKLTVNTDDPYSGPALLIVDSSGTSSPQSEIKVNGIAGFCGVIWSIGEAKITGNSVVNGAVFIDGDPLVDNDILGNTAITFDPGCIDLVLSPFASGTPRLVSWKEYAQ